MMNINYQFDGLEAHLSGDSEKMGFWPFLWAIILIRVINVGRSAHLGGTSPWARILDCIKRRK